MSLTTEEGAKTLDQVAPLLRAAYEGWKRFEQEKNDFKAQFFALADEALAQDGLGIRLYDVSAASEAEARTRAQRHNPGWLVGVLRPHRVEPDAWEVILHEDPALKPFTLEHEGMRYGRQVSRGVAMVDDEWLQKADPDLYKTVTYQLPWGERTVIPVEHMNKDWLGRLAKYIYTTTPRVSLRVAAITEDV